MLFPCIKQFHWNLLDIRTSITRTRMGQLPRSIPRRGFLQTVTRLIGRTGLKIDGNRFSVRSGALEEYAEGLLGSGSSRPESAAHP